MNLTHLGDALDHWKGSVIETIREEKLQVVPMLTDPGRWTQDHVDAYARLLHVRPDDILKKGKDDLFSSRTRRSYFCHLGEHDLFLDPDTGVSPGGKAKKEHLLPSEIAKLLSQPSARMLLIYQHASHDKDGVRERLKLLRSTEGLEGCHMFAYDAGAVSMIVISPSRERTDKARESLGVFIGPVSTRRIIEWP